MDDFDPFELEVLRSSTSESTDLPISDETLICECVCITFGEIKEHVKDAKIDFDFLRKEYGLGTGCKSCIRTLKNLKKD